MKFKTTKKQMKEYYGSKLYSIGYCNAQYLFTFEQPTAYSTRAEGWACDYYEVNNICFSTGYSPVGKPVNYELLKKYDDQARTVLYSNINPDIIYNTINNLLNDFINELLNK